MSTLILEKLYNTLSKWKSKKYYFLLGRKAKYRNCYFQPEKEKKREKVI